MVPSFEVLAREVGMLRAERQVTELPRRYGRGIDRKDWSLVSECFVGGVMIEGSRRTLPGPEYWRKQEIDLRVYPRTMHCMHNQQSVLSDEAGSVETYCVAMHWTAGSLSRNAPPDLSLGVIYHDDVVAGERGWLISHRRVEPVWRAGEYPLTWDRGRL